MSAKLNGKNGDEEEEEDATLKEVVAVDFGGKNVDWSQLMSRVSAPRGHMFIYVLGLIR